MYEFHDDYMVPKYGENLALCCMDTVCSFIELKLKIFMPTSRTMRQQDSIHPVT